MEGSNSANPRPSEPELLPDFYYYSPAGSQTIFASMLWTILNHIPILILFIPGFVSAQFGFFDQMFGHSGHHHQHHQQRQGGPSQWVAQADAGMYLPAASPKLTLARSLVFAISLPRHAALCGSAG
jgi:hypothetical protein